MEKMPSGTWLSCTAVSRLISALDDRKTRARLDRPNARRQNRMQARAGQPRPGLSVPEAFVSNGPPVGRDGVMVPAAAAAVNSA
jgi:hypothetical protein